MRPHLGPPRELFVRRFETDHRRTMRLLASATTTVASGWMVAIALFSPHARLGGRLVELIAAVAGLAIVWSFKRPSKRNVVGLLILAWTIVVAVFVITFYDR